MARSPSINLLAKELCSVQAILNVPISLVVVRTLEGFPQIKKLLKKVQGPAWRGCGGPNTKNSRSDFSKVPQDNKVSSFKVRDRIQERSLSQWAKNIFKFDLWCYQ
jgi:hypothetical protein